MAVVHLARGRHRRAQAGHPWVFQTEVERVGGQYQPGDIVDVVDSYGKFLGRGYINPRSQILVRILTMREESIDVAFLRNRITQAWRYRQRVLADTECCRVIFGEADFLPGLIVDKFGDILVLQTLALGIDCWRSEIVAALDELLQPSGIYERNDAPIRALEGLEQRKGFLKGPFDPRLVITENGAKVAVDVAEGQKTGYFLDQRDNRRAVRRYARGGRVLDCFCNVGGFALNAAMGGAAEVLAVDASAEAIAGAVENARLNELDSRMRFEMGNAFDVLRRLDAEKQRFDLIILDPPAFAKNRAAVPGALRGYKELNLRAIRMLPAGGFLVTCSCSYHVKPDMFREVIQDAARDARRRLRLIEERGQAPDHPVLLGYDESHYLKCLIFEVV